MRLVPSEKPSGRLASFVYESRPPLLHQGALGGHFGQVMLLVGVLGQVEQVLSSVQGPPDVFELAIGEGVESLLLAVTRRVLRMQALADHLLLPAENGQQADAGHRPLVM